MANRFLFPLLMSVVVHVRPKKYFVTFMQKLGAKMGILLWLHNLMCHRWLPVSCVLFIAII